MVCGRIVRIELKGPFELLFGAGPIPIEPVQQLSQRVVCLCELIIKLERFLHRLLGEARIVGELVDVREAGVGRRIVWIFFDRLLEI